MTRIFISYSRVDKKITKDLVDLLNHAYDHVWYDTAKLVGGDNWWTQILIEIEQCDHFIFLLSAEALASEYCKRELNKAIDLQKHVIPVQIRHLGTIKHNLENLQIIKMLDEITVDGLNLLYSTLIRSNNSNSFLVNAKMKADRELLQQLWKCINSSNIENIDWQITHQRMIQSALYNSTFSDYFRIRRRTENHFNNNLLEKAFSSFDIAVDNFRSSFAQLSKGDLYEDEHYYTIAYEAEMQRDFWEEKYNTIIEKLSQMYDCHEIIVETAKSIYPDFTFTLIEEK